MTGASNFRKVAICSGHMIDAPGREVPPFPERKAAAVREKIAEQLARWEIGAGDLAICGGACGSDILFADALSLGRESNRRRAGWDFRFSAKNLRSRRNSRDHQPDDPAVSAAFDYLQRRLEPQEKWHDQRARLNKRLFYTAEVATLLAGAAIPVVNLWVVKDAYLTGILSASLGGVVVLAAAIGKLFKFHENWLHYRALVEALARERELYSVGAGDYARVGPLGATAFSSSGWKT